MAHSLCSIHIHVVFSTKDRLPLIGNGVHSDLHAYLGGIVRQLEGKPVIINGLSEHVHLLLRLPPSLAVSECMRALKANSSKWLHENGYGKFAWQSGYAAFSVSTSNFPKVVDYIGDQQQHHQKMTSKMSCASSWINTGLNSTSATSGAGFCRPRRGSVSNATSTQGLRPGLHILTPVPGCVRDEGNY
jgi:putative transposase